MRQHGGHFLECAGRDGQRQRGSHFQHYEHGAAERGRGAHGAAGVAKRSPGVTAALRAKSGSQIISLEYARCVAQPRALVKAASTVLLLRRRLLLLLLLLLPLLLLLLPLDVVQPHEAVVQYGKAAS